MTFIHICVSWILTWNLITNKTRINYRPTTATSQDQLRTFSRKMLPKQMTTPHNKQTNKQKNNVPLLAKKTKVRVLQIKLEGVFVVLFTYNQNNWHHDDPPRCLHYPRAHYTTTEATKKKKRTTAHTGLSTRRCGWTRQNDSTKMVVYCARHFCQSGSYCVHDSSATFREVTSTDGGSTLLSSDLVFCGCLSY